MALPPTRQCLLLIILVLVVMAIPAGANDDRDVTGGILMYECDPEPRWQATANGTAFRASLAPLLAALPSAAAPTGSASLRSGNKRASVRGLCFGESPPPKECRQCMSMSVDRIGICSGSRRAGFWNSGCFLAYADDTNATSPTRDREDEWFTLNFEYEGDVFNHYPDFYDVYKLVNLALSLAPRAARGGSSGGRMLATANATAQANSTVRALAQCPGNVTAADCARCLEKSARDLPEFLPVRRQEYDRVQSAGVFYAFRYKCYLQLVISAPILPVGKGARIRKRMKDHLAVVVVVGVAIVVVIFGAAFLVLKRIRTRKAQAATQSHILPAS
ncbi:hypothetical protein QYE76_035744 [Lolium multiflorum]|uniref:Gnk2-homologous domain-containing protein n=1 Tax=Lolium multiflorum TaxID=4521 RepID=A0AAD8R1G9_LOLMU|nr:hypothetical protein QYE76_035744 [Lolium multiflorum]